MTARLAAIGRFPVKSIGGETLERVTLTAGETLPGDRAFGVLHEGARRYLEDDELRVWLPKAAFLRGAASAPLQAIRGGWTAAGRLRLTHPDRPDIEVDADADDAPLLAWLAPLWPADKAPPARLVSAPQALTDSKLPFVSLLSLSSLADLEARLGRRFGTERWRANLWVEGWPPHAEHDMRLMPIRIGPALVRVRERIGRCAATSADTATGDIDIDMPAALQAEFDHQDFGVYVEVVEGGEIAVGDRVEVL